MDIKGSAPEPARKISTQKIKKMSVSEIFKSKILPWFLLVGLLSVGIYSLITQSQKRREEKIMLNAQRALLVDSILTAQVLPLVAQYQAEGVVYRQQIDSLTNENEKLEKHLATLAARLDAINRQLGKRPKF
jgi:cell division protein FtsB